MIGRYRTWSRDDCGWGSLGFTGVVEMFGYRDVTGSGFVFCSATTQLLLASNCRIWLLQVQQHNSVELLTTVRMSS